nr:Uncharacterised protein [Klebsiella pneumoniae]
MAFHIRNAIGSKMAAGFHVLILLRTDSYEKPLLALLLVASQSAFADKIPDSIENLIAVYDTRSHSTDNGELTIKYSKPKLLIDAAESLFSGICNDYFMNKWKPETIKKSLC